jgi:hypothetical protein
VRIGKGAIQTTAQPDAGEQTAKAGDEENDPLNNAGTDGMLQVTVLDPTEEMLFRGDADTAAHNEPEWRQHEAIAPRVQ